jgi:hypothetical protein
MIFKYRVRKRRHLKKGSAARSRTPHPVSADAADAAGECPLVMGISVSINCLIVCKSNPKRYAASYYLVIPSINDKD